MSQTARRLGPQDMFFLYSESSTTMMHVGALMPFTPPSGAPPDLLRQLVDESKASEVVETLEPKTEPSGAAIPSHAVLGR